MHLSTLSRSVAFPEVWFPALNGLRRFAKEVKNMEFSKQARALIRTAETNSKLVQQLRCKLDYGAKGASKFSCIGEFIRSIALLWLSIDGSMVVILTLNKPPTSCNSLLRTEDSPLTFPEAKTPMESLYNTLLKDIVKAEQILDEGIMERHGKKGKDENEDEEQYALEEPDEDELEMEEASDRPLLLKGLDASGDQDEDIVEALEMSDDED